MSAPKKIRIALIEDNQRAARNVSATLEASDRFELVAAYVGGQQALREISAAAPDLILMDVGLPDAFGPDLIPEIKSALPESKIVAWTVFEDDQVILDTMLKGGNGFLLKDTPPDRLLVELQVVALGGSSMTPRIAERILRKIEPTRGDAVARGEPSLLSERETQVLNLLSLGLTYRDVAADLGISEHTVRRHLEKVYRKLDVHSRSDAVRKGRQMGLVRPS